MAWIERRSSGSSWVAGALRRSKAPRSSMSRSRSPMPGPPRIATEDMLPVMPRLPLGNELAHPGALIRRQHIQCLGSRVEHVRLHGPLRGCLLIEKCLRPRDVVRVVDQGLQDGLVTAAELVAIRGVLLMQIGGAALDL